jgi:hypothetical protein
MERSMKISMVPKSVGNDAINQRIVEARSFSLGGMMMENLPTSLARLTS